MTVDTDATADRPAVRRTLYALLGAAQGGLLYLLDEYGELLITAESIRIAIAIWLVSGPALFLLAEQAGRRLAAAVFAGGMALLFAGLYLSVDARFAGSLRSDDVVVLWVAIAGIAIVALPFFRCWAETGRLRFPYPRLFHHAWNTPYIVGGAWVFVGAVWMAEYFWMRLFKLIDVNFFSVLFQEAWFSSLATGLAAGLAVSMLRDWASVAGAWRGVVVAMAVALLVLFLHFIGLVIGLTPLWRPDSPTTILLSAFAVAALLINSVIGDADETATRNRVLRTAAMTLVVLLPVLAALAGVSAVLRIAQYGLTPERAYGAILIALAGLCALAYLWALTARRRGWAEGVRTLNVRLAAAVAVVAVAVCTPMLDVQRMSADNQVDRLLSGRVPADEFDFNFLNHGLGYAGVDALARLRAAEDHPEHADIVAGIELAEQASIAPRYDW